VDARSSTDADISGCAALSKLVALRTQPFYGDAVSTGPADDAVAALFDNLSSFARSLRSLAHRHDSEFPSLRRSDVMLLRTLAEQGECRLSDLSHRLALNPSVISRQLADLEADGIVDRRADPDDGRAGLVSLSRKGREQLEAVRETYAAILSEQLVGWDPQRIAQASDLLHDLSRALARELVHADRSTAS